MNDIEQSLPEQWRPIFRVFALPIAWLPHFQTLLLTGAWSSDSVVITVLKRVFLLLPAFSAVAAFWCTMLSVYTVLFRWNRSKYVVTLLVCWWDLARSVWLFWAGMLKFVFVFIGSFWGLLHF